MNLERILEPEWMDTEEEAETYDAMDHREVNEAFVERLLEVAGAEGLFLDLGTGPAHIPLRLVERAPAARVVALDAARAMFRVARRRLAASPQGRRVRLVLGDAKRLPLRDASVDAVFSNTILHHLADPVPLLVGAARVVRPGGAILLRDLLRPSDEEALERLVRRHAADAEGRARRLFRDSLHAAFTLEEVRGLLEAAGLADLELAQTSDRHWTAWRAVRG